MSNYTTWRFAGSIRRVYVASKCTICYCFTEDSGRKRVSKKWYNMFVSVDAAGSGTGEETGEAPPTDAAKMVADIAASVPAAATFSAPVANPSSFGEIYEAAEIAVPA